MKRFSWFLLLLLLLVPAMSACSGSDDDSDKSTSDQDDADKKKQEAEKAHKKKDLPICPQVAIVRELDTIRDYGDDKPDKSGLVAAARLKDVSGDCAYPDDGGIDIEFNLDMIAQRGPRLGGQRDSFPFFVAVVDPDGNILNKEKMIAEFKFPSDPKEISDKTENLHVSIPLVKDKRDTGPYYRVLIGFQLTHEQLDAIRAKENAEPSVPSPRG